MEHRALGRSGVDVSRLILGCGNFGGIGSSPAFFGAGETEGEAHALLDAAWDAGITTYDTADAYGGGRSESYIGSWLGAKGAEVRERIVLTTKTFNPMTDGADQGSRPSGSGASSSRASDASASTRSSSTSPTRWIPPSRSRRRSVRSQSSPTPGRSVPNGGQATSTRRRLDEALRHAPARLGAELLLACSSAATNGDVLPVCVREGLGYTPFGPLAGGWLTGKYRRGEDAPAGSRMTLRPEPYSTFWPTASTTRSRPSRRWPESARRHRRHSRSPGCSPTRGDRGRDRPAPARAARARRSTRSSCASPRPSTSSSERCSHERPRPFRARRPRAPDDGGVHRGDGRACSRNSGAASCTSRCVR